MEAIELTVSQREQMAALVGQLNTTRTVAEAFVGYFARELGVNLQVYQFNADSFRFEPVGGMAPHQITPAAPQGAPGPATGATRGAAETKFQPEAQPENGRVEAI